MRVLFSRLRTTLAIAAALLLILKIPEAYHLITTPDIMLHNKAKSTVVLRVWYCENWTGSGMKWLLSQVAAFEKANPETRVTVRRVQKDEWQTDGIVPPDVLLFEAGVMRQPEEWLSHLKKEYPVKGFLKFSGMRYGLSYAVPVCYGGNVRLINENKKDGIELVMQAEQQYQDFALGKAGVLIASIREARRLSALQEAGKGFPFQAEPYGEKTSMVLYASVFGNAGERAGSAHALLDHLLSETAQSSLQDAGLLPVIDTASPDEKKHPLLFAVNARVHDAVNAFD